MVSTERYNIHIPYVGPALVCCYI